MDEFNEIKKERNLDLKKSVFEPEQEANDSFQLQAGELHQDAFKLRDELRNATYVIKKGKKGKANTLGKKTDHTKPMTDVIESVDQLQQALSWDISTDEDMFRAQLGSVKGALKAVLFSCDTYLNGHKNPHSKEGQVRKSHVQKIRNMIVRDMEYLDFRAEEALREAREAGPEQEDMQEHGEYEIILRPKRNWLDVFAKARIEVIRKDKDTVIDKIGDSGSDLMRVSKRGQKDRYLKPDETVVQPSLESAFESVKKKNEAIIHAFSNADSIENAGLDQEKATKKQRKAQFAIDVAKEFCDSLKQKRGSSYLKNSKANILIGALDESLTSRRHSADNLKTLIRHLDIGGTAFANRINELDEKSKGVDPLKEDPFEKQLEEIYDAIYSLFVQMNVSDLACNVARVKPGSSLGNRNVATSRIADFLGVGDLVVKSEMKEIEIGGVKQKCLEMEEAQGKESLWAPDNVNKAGGKVCRYSAKAVRKLSDLQILDIICGQVDRHGNNFFLITIETKEKIIADDVNGIDNDLSWGTLTYEEILDAQKYQQIRSAQNKDLSMRIPAMSSQLAEKIMQLTPGMVEYLLIDLLSKEEIEAAKNRVAGLQKMIERQRELERNNPGMPSKFAETKEDWERVRNEIESKAEDEVEAQRDHDRANRSPLVRHEGELFNSTYYQATWLNVNREGRAYKVVKPEN